MYKDIQQAAAVMFDPVNGSAGLLHHELADELEELQEMLPGYNFREQEIAVAVHGWMKRNPEKQPYHPEG